MDAFIEKQMVWSWWQMLAFRFFSIFFLLFIAVNPNIFQFILDPLYRRYMLPLQDLATWTSTHIFSLQQSLSFAPTGSSDTLARYIFLFLISVASVTGTIIWSFLRRNDKNYNRLFYSVMVIIRFYLGLTMISYGISKVLKVQFPNPSLLVLEKTLGSSSPMGFAWAFFGYSKAYNYFMGFAEICSILLLFRRTALLGAIITLFVAMNVMAVNYCFNISVKILSTALVVMSIFLIVPYLKRLFDFFIFNKAVQPAHLTPAVLKKKWQRIVVPVLKYTLIGFVVVASINICLYARTRREREAKQNIALGSYTVKEFLASNTGDSKWNRVTITADSIHIESSKNNRSSYQYTINSVDKKLLWFTDDGSVYSFNYSDHNSGELILKGHFNKDDVTVKLYRDNQFNSGLMNDINSRLMNDEFHWISE